MFEQLKSGFVVWFDFELSNKVISFFFGPSGSILIIFNGIMFCE